MASSLETQAGSDLSRGGSFLVKLSQQLLDWPLELGFGLRRASRVSLETQGRTHSMHKGTRIGLRAYLKVHR